MDVGVTTATRYPNNSTVPGSTATNNEKSAHTHHHSHAHHHKKDSHPSTPNKHVNFTGPAEEKKREKFLTAKYGAHQMALIRKRLRVEMWMYERLQELYGAVRNTVQ